jgi:serine/threonine-protein kinase
MVIVEGFGLAPGQRVGGYEIVDAIGGGGMGMVYHAVHVLLGRPAAIKVLRPEYNHVPAIVHRFSTEAKLTTTIRHPGIVEIFDYGHTDGGHAYIAMELLCGDNLGQRLARTGRMPPPIAAVIARRIAGALAAAHERGVIHRDLKPDNVQLVRDPDGGPIDQIKILDFGIARLIDGRAYTARTTTGVVMGTPMYMAPEQCRGISDSDHRADLYSLGCVMFEMVVGRPPYVETGTSALLAAHLQSPIPDVRAHAPDVPLAMARLIEALLAKDPALRPQTADDVVVALDEMMERPPRRHRERSLAAVVVGAASLIAVTVGVWIARARRGATIPPPIPAPHAAVSTRLPTEPMPPTIMLQPVRVIGTAPTLYEDTSPPPDAEPAPVRRLTPSSRIDDVESDLGDDEDDEQAGVDTIVRD